MKLLSKKVFIGVSFLLLVSFFSSVSFAHASIVDNLVNSAKNIFSPSSSQKVTLVSTIALAPDGDINKNGDIDAGDIVRFTYTLTNTTPNDYVMGTLKTNLDRKTLNFIHNITGTASLDDNGETIIIPYIHLGKGYDFTISFDARVNYFNDQDKTLTTNAEFVTKEGNSLVKAESKQAKVKKIDKNKLDSLTISSIKSKTDKE